jgi:phosphate/sulfate permease
MFFAEGIINKLMYNNMADIESTIVSWILSPIGLLVTVIVVAVIIAWSVIYIINNR